MDMGPSEILIVLAIALVLLGPSRLPSLARSLGEAIHELRRSAHGDDPTVADGARTVGRSVELDTDGRDPATG
jgi:TatA/E family protein of Tat protein translocase